jgi:uncharacterized protein (DUF697 family)
LFYEEGKMNQRINADKIVKSHVIWAAGAGFMPVPLLDIAAVTAIQTDMLNQLAALYEAQNYSLSTGKTFVTALAGSTLARIGASMLKALPGIGTVVGGLSMPLLSGASTYAVAQAAIPYFEAGGDLSDLDWEAVKKAYHKAYEQGKEFVAGLEQGDESFQTAYRELQELRRLRDAGMITGEEYEAKKRELLADL